MTQELSATEKLCWLRLSRSENVGPITFNKLLDRFGTAEESLKGLPSLAKRGGNKSFTPFPADAAKHEMEQIEKSGAQLIARCEKNYPHYLAEIEDAPPVITVLGNTALLSKPGLGVVGARNASLSGRKIAEDFSRKVGAAGYPVISGLARGIDTAAHRATLATGTVAVVAGGINVIYPPENKDLYQAIAVQGAIVAESPFGTEPLARHFPRRNRIISGLALGVLVVEAAARSGSLITARMALEQNRELFAVPGSPADPRAEGPNNLIRDGAHLTTSAADILHVLQSLRLAPLRDSASGHWTGAPPDSGTQRITAPDERLYDKIIECLSHTPVTIDSLIRAVEAPTGDVLTILLELELAGRIERQPGNRVNLI